MFEALDAIPVTFGPHEGDVWMIAATLLSFATSLVVAVVAARNGQKATRIAEEASDRDEKHRLAEAERLERESRAAVTLAMLRTFAALEQQKWDPSSNPLDKTSEESRRVSELEFEALAQIDLYPLEPEDEELRVWLSSAVATIKQAPLHSHWDMSVWTYSFMDQLAYARMGAAAWNKRVLTASQLVMGEWPPDSDEEASVEEPGV